MNTPETPIFNNSPDINRLIKYLDHVYEFTITVGDLHCEAQRLELARKMGRKDIIQDIRKMMR